jgi:hypothetical protein
MPLLHASLHPVLSTLAALLSSIHGAQASAAGGCGKWLNYNMHNTPNLLLKHSNKIIITYIRNS